MKTLPNTIDPNAVGDRPAGAAPATPEPPPPASGSERRWKVGEIARCGTLTCCRALILNDEGDSYCVMFGHGVVSYVKHSDLYTLPAWLKWFEMFRDELPPKDFRCYETAAKCDFAPPTWWDEAVKNAMEPFSQNH